MSELNNGYRPCVVDGKRGLFHGWVDKEQVLFKSLINTKIKDRVSIFDHFNKNDFIMHTDLEPLTTIKCVVGLVEFAYGAIEEVKPINIKFLDSEDFVLESARKLGESKTRKGDTKAIYCAKYKQVTAYKFTNENKDYVFDELKEILSSNERLYFVKRNGAGLHIRFANLIAQEGDYIVIVDKDAAIFEVLNQEKFDSKYEKAGK